MRVGRGQEWRPRWRLNAHHLCSADSRTPSALPPAPLPRGATQNRWGHAVPTPEQRHAQEVCRAPGEPPRRPAGAPLTCWAALSASSANSTDRPFSACLRDPHVLLFRAAQEGSGVVSDPKALRDETGGDTQGQSNPTPPSAWHPAIGVTRTRPEWTRATQPAALGSLGAC